MRLVEEMMRQGAAKGAHCRAMAVVKAVGEGAEHPPVEEGAATARRVVAATVRLVEAVEEGAEHPPKEQRGVPERRAAAAQWRVGDRVNQGAPATWVAKASGRMAARQVG